MHVQTSPNFKRYARKTIISIIAFSIIYILIMLLIALFTAAVIYGGFKLITEIHSPLTLAVGIPLIVSALFMSFLVIRFIFASTKSDLSLFIEIKESDEPDLFALIREVAQEVGTKFPNKIYLSLDVDASVFFDANFLSMFFPIRKNLQIGMGLINSLTHQEFKAVLAHELGHFSQKSMKLGSYVYNINKIIHNTLYRNSFLDNLNDWTVSNRFRKLFVWKSIFIITGIQSVLKKLYSYVNINFMALSREMEFNADEIAANVAGSKALSDALLRLSFSNFALENVFHFYDKRLDIKSQNLYIEHHFMMLFLAIKNKYPLNGNLPVIELDRIKKFPISKLNIEDQLASHPSDEDRIQAINKLNIIKTEVNNTNAIKILKNETKLAYEVTNIFFSILESDSECTEIDYSKFFKDFVADFEDHSFNDLYNGFYDVNNPVIKDISTVDKSPVNVAISELFNDEHIKATYELDALIRDKNLLTFFSTQESVITSFDYDGIRYKLTQAPFVLKRLENEIAEKENQINNYNTEVYRYFYHLAKSKNKEEELRSLYEQFVDIDQILEDSIKFDFKIRKHIGFFFGNTSPGMIESHLEDFKKMEHHLRQELSGLLRINLLKDILDHDMYKSLLHYLGNPLSYEATKGHVSANIKHVFSALSAYQKLRARQYHLKKKEILNFQIILLQQNA